MRQACPRGSQAQLIALRNDQVRAFDGHVRDEAGDDFPCREVVPV
jgi:hypothetical protein